MVRSVALVPAVLALFGLALPIEASAACQIESFELPVKIVGSRVVATVGINGTPVPLMVDSGAFYSMLTDGVADELNLRMKKGPAMRVEGITGRIDVRTTTVAKLQFLKGEFSSIDFLVGGNEPGAGTRGLIGRNILSLVDTEYDLAHGAIRFLFPNDDCAKAGMAYWAGQLPVTEVDLIDNFRSKVPAIRVAVKLNGHDLVALFDSGATTLVTKRAAKRAGIADADLVPAGQVFGAGRGRSEAWTANFETFEIGGETIRRNRLRVADIDIDDADLLLGIDFFLSHRIYVSKQQSRMFLTYIGGPIFALDSKDDVGRVPSGLGAAASGAEAMSADQLARRGAASVARRDYQSALADLDRACDLEPTSAALFAQRGAIEEALGKHAKALEDFDKSLTLDPDDVDARLRRATLRLGAKNAEGASDDLEALDRAVSPQAQMRLAMARLYLELDKPALAIPQLDRWLSTHPTEATRDGALNGRCWARVLLGTELDRALDDCDDAIGADARNPAYYDSRGWVYLRMGRYQKAVADFDRGIALRPKDASALYGRGIAKARLGDATQGDLDLAAARKVQPDIDARLTRLGLMPAAAPKS